MNKNVTEILNRLAGQVPDLQSDVRSVQATVFEDVTQKLHQEVAAAGKKVKAKTIKHLKNVVPRMWELVPGSDLSLESFDPDFDQMLRVKEWEKRVKKPFERALLKALPTLPGVTWNVHLSQFSKATVQAFVDVDSTLLQEARQDENFKKQEAVLNTVLRGIGGKKLILDSRTPSRIEWSLEPQYRMRADEFESRFEEEDEDYAEDTWEMTYEEPLRRMVRALMLKAGADLTKYRVSVDEKGFVQIGYYI